MLYLSEKYTDSTESITMPHSWLLTSRIIARDKVNVTLTNWYLMSGYSESVAHSVAICSAQRSSTAA